MKLVFNILVQNLAAILVATWDNIIEYTKYLATGMGNIFQGIGIRFSAFAQVISLYAQSIVSIFNILVENSKRLF